MEIGVLRVLPPHVALLGLCVALVCFFLIIRTERSVMLRFLALALWARYISGEFPIYTFRSVGGASIISLVSLATIGVGVLLVGFRAFRSPMAIPCYALIFANLSSGVLNGYMGGAIDGSIKAVYFLVIATAAMRAYLEVGTYRVARVLMLALAVPLAFQFIGFVFGVAKANETDGSASVIGGFNHESGFSMVSLTFILVAGIFAANWKARGLGLLAIGIASIVLANYRTALIAALPIIAAIVLVTTSRGIRNEQKILLSVIMLPMIGFVILAGIHFQDRFVDLFASAGEFDRLFVIPDHYTIDARRLMSGRPYIWSQYLSAYLRGSNMQLLFGFGPSSWEGNFKVYAHNTLVSALYDTGIVGFLASLSFLSLFLGMSLRSLQGRHRILILLAYVGFFVLNMSTMPIWSIEGLIFYSLLVGLSFSEAVRVPAQKRLNGTVGPRLPGFRHDFLSQDNALRRDA